MYIDNEKEQHLRDINAALRELDQLIGLRQMKLFSCLMTQI